MNVDDIVFEDYIICPICKKQMGSLSPAHLIYKHGYTGMKQFKIEYGIPMCAPLVAKIVRAVMVKKGKMRSKWFRENVMMKGVEYARTFANNKIDMVPKEVRAHVSKLRKGQPQDWLVTHISEMEQKGWLDLHKASELLGVSYNYTRKCATDGRLKVILEKSIRFTTIEWIDEAKKLLQENRKKVELNKQRFSKINVKHLDNWEEVYREWKSGKITVKSAAEKLGICRSTFYLRVKKYEK